MVPISCPLLELLCEPWGVTTYDASATPVTDSEAVAGEGAAPAAVPATFPVDPKMCGN